MKIDFKLIHRLADELEKQIEKAETVKSNGQDYVVEMSKAAGLSSSIVEEGRMLGIDIANLIVLNTSENMRKVHEDDLEEDLSASKESFLKRSSKKFDPSKN